MSTPSKKKSQNAEFVQNAGNAYQSEVQEAGQNVVDAMKTAGAQQIADMDAANQAYNEANQAAIEANRQQSGAAIGSFADMVEGYARNIRNAEAEGAAQVAADQRAARWTGATELASSIANLIAVGGHNAVSQQYRPYSQDWMRKADMDARMNRMRIDNLRERQRAMQGQLANLRLNDAARALELAREQAKTNYQQRLSMAEATYNNTVNPLNQAAKNAEAVGKIGYQVATDVASTNQRDKQLDLSAASLAQRQREHNAEMMAKGYNPDGTINEEAMSKIVKASQAAKGSGSGKNSGNSYDVTVDGNRYTIDMADKTFNAAIEFGNADLKKDIVKMSGANDWNDLKNRIEKKGDLQDYAQIVKAIEAGGEDNLNTIRTFISNNRDDLNEFNSHLIRVANSGRLTGTTGAKANAPVPEEKKTEGPVSIDDEFNVTKKN